MLHQRLVALDLKLAVLDASDLKLVILDLKLVLWTSSLDSRTQV